MALIISCMPVTLLTVYAVPTLYVHDLRGLKAIRYGFTYLKRHGRESIVLLSLLLVMGIMSLAVVFLKPTPWQNNFWYISLSSLETFVACYVYTIVFLSAALILTGERVKKAMTGPPGA